MALVIHASLVPHRSLSRFRTQTSEFSARLFKHL
jgi:hypothetical protein